MGNENIEYFKRFAAAYMRWANFEFDRIVKDILKKDIEEQAKRKEALKLKMIMAGLPKYASSADFIFDFDKDVNFGIKIIKPSDILVL